MRVSVCVRRDPRVRSSVASSYCVPVEVCELDKLPRLKARSGRARPTAREGRGELLLAASTAPAVRVR